MKGYLVRTLISSFILLALVTVSVYAVDISLSAVSISDDGTAGWALGGNASGPLFFRLDKGGWTKDSTLNVLRKTKFTPSSICISADGKKAYAAGYKNNTGRIYEYDGNKWNNANPGDTNNIHITSICCSSNGDKAWAASTNGNKSFLWKMGFGKWSKSIITFKDTPTTWDITKIEQAQNGQKLFAIGQARYGSLHNTGLFLKNENNKWQMIDLKPLANTPPHRTNGFTDIYVDPSGSEVLVAGWKFYYPEKDRKEEILPMICRYDGKVLKEIKMEKLPAIMSFTKAAGKIHAISPEENGFAIFCHNGKSWQRTAFFTGMEMNSIAFSTNGEIGFITGMKSAKGKKTPAVIQYKDGKWKEINL